MDVVIKYFLKMGNKPPQLNLTAFISLDGVINRLEADFWMWSPAEDEQNSRQQPLKATSKQLASRKSLRKTHIYTYMNIK